ncbi:hypothetical protein BBJ28_00015510 [Nothophytophthora sp. Chile5]|nr:hypothetical protein BBJ28_00015510 [Nothophytophthora sp. Chile5]
MNLSPAPDLYRVSTQRTTGQMALLPLVLMCFNNHLWLLYGLLTDSIFPLCAAASVGELAGIVFTAVYYRWARDTTQARKICSLTFIGMLTVTMYVLLGNAGYTHQSFSQVVQTLGYVGATINICMYASPLATVKGVLETKSSASLPINLCAMIFLNCCMWVATSIVDDDMFVLIPSAIGLALSGFQLPLYFLYRPDPHQYIDLDAQPNEGFGQSIKRVLSTESDLPTTYRTVRPSRVARFATYKYQRAEGVPLTVGSEPVYATVDRSPHIFGSRSPMLTTLSSLNYSSGVEEYADLEMQPLLMTPIAVV